MNEDFLHYLWRFKLWNKNLKTTDGQDITIVKNGIYNTDGGPDFLNAKLQIGDTIWAGHVEIHLKASDWYKHKHNENTAYNNVILHVVHEADCEIRKNFGIIIPCCCIAQTYSSETIEKYTLWQSKKDFIACESQISEIASIKQKLVFERLCIERLEEKVNEIIVDLAYNRKSWEETFYQYLLRSFGLQVNAHSFYRLAKSTPLKYLQKHSNNRLQLEAILFGQADLLEQSYQDSYPKALQEDYFYLQKKFGLVSITPTTVNFLRLRPSSFPTLRLSFFADLIFKHNHLFSLILDEQNPDKLRQCFTLSSSSYWDTHYVFDKESLFKVKHLGEQAQLLILIHAVIPFLFAYGRHIGKESLCENAISLMQNLPPENNIVIKNWKKYGIIPENATESQALLHLKKSYCESKHCLNCAFGSELLAR